MKLFGLTILIFISISIPSFAINPTNLESQATITSIETNTSGRRTYDTAKIWFTTTKGDTIATQVQLNGLPFIGSLKGVGDSIDINYQEENPYLVQTVSSGFLQKYAWHIIIGIILLFYGYKIIKRKKTAN